MTAAAFVTLRAETRAPRAPAGRIHVAAPSNPPPAHPPNAVLSEVLNLGRATKGLTPLAVGRRGGDRAIANRARVVGGKGGGQGRLERKRGGGGE